MMKSDGNPIDPTQRLRSAPRCRATTKSAGQRCKCPSKQGWNVCRVHGAGGGAPSCTQHPNYRHGLRTNELAAIRLVASLLGKSMPRVLDERSNRLRSFITSGNCGRQTVICGGTQWAMSAGTFLRA